MDPLPSFLTVKRIPGIASVALCQEKMRTRRGTCMPNDVTEIENELRSVTQVKHQVEEQIVALQQCLHDDEIWLKMNTPATSGYQEAREEILALPAYITELYAQVMSLDDVLLELALERECWDNSDPFLAS
jgi:hypothetical protein